MSKFKDLTVIEILVYVVFFSATGFIMNTIGQEFEIAKFNNWWQVFTCYILYMVPVAILIRDYSVFNQYAYGLVAMGVLEFAGYALETSYVYPNNILIQYFGPYTFALAMSLFFALYFPFSNWLIKLINDRLLAK
ncbi:hypothetical protein [Ulvibacter antarcticus]|nr:hypothetical protein [Ulvibacter antarcticus]